MKVAKQKTRVKIGGGIETKAFGIVFDRHMVNILSNQLYKNKVLALVRELSTNAKDSQQEAGYSDPFDVHLPSWADATFWIRDYGTGMSPEKIDTIYRKYGSSDRSESNDYTGCMGLGSKTPFCYNTKTFTVDSWCGGMHYTYACFLDEDGMPQIAPMSQEASDEHSGVKITLPARSGDTYDFCTAANRIYKFFSVAPNMVGEDVAVTKPNYTLEDDNWKYDENESNGMKIIMGDVAYNVSVNSLGELTTTQTKVVKTGFHIYVDIGEVGVTASREGLDYTNRTKTHIRNYINNIIKSFNAKAQKNISNCKNLWEARLRFVEYERDNLRGIFDSSKITYNGNKLFDDDGYIDCRQMVHDEKIIINHFPYQTYRKITRGIVHTIRAQNKPIFYTNDLKVGSFVRSIAECKKHQTNVILVKFLTDGAKKEFCELLGVDDSYFTDISTIPSPTVRTAGKKRGKITKVVKFIDGSNCYGHKNKSEYWNNAEVDVKTDKGIYVEFNRFNAKVQYMAIPSSLATYVGILKSAGIKVPNIYGVKTAYIKKFENSANWTDFYTWGKAQVEAAVRGKDLITKQKYREELDRLGSDGYHTNRRWITARIHDLAAFCDDNTELVKYSNEVKLAEQNAKGYSKMQSLISACDRFNIKKPSPKVNIPNLKLKEMEDAVYKKYKLLGCTSYEKLSKCLNHFGLYINSVG